MICSKLGKYLDLEIKLPSLKLDESLYKKKIQEILDSNVLLKKKNTPIELGDEVILRFCGYDQQNEIIPFTRDDAHKAIIGEGTLRKEFEEAVIGKQTGNTITLDMVFPPDHDVYANMPVHFLIEIRAVYNRKLPELTDEFVAGMEIERISTVKELEDFTRAYVLSVQKRDFEDSIRHNIMKQIIDASDFEISDEERAKQITAHAADFKKTILYEGFTLDDYLDEAKITHDEFLIKFQDRALYTLKYRCVVRKIAELENISVSDDEVKSEGTQIAASHELSYKEFMMMSQDGYRKLKEDVLKKKVVEFVISRAHFIETE